MAKRVLTTSGIALLCTLASNAQALDVTANVGYMSEYIFRGISQSDSSAMAGVDVTEGGFYAGTWAADVDEGLEVDLYAGYKGMLGDLSYGIGATGYLYTDDFDDDYTEVNLSLGYGIFSVSAAIGEYDNFDESTLDYTYIAPRVDYEGFYGLVGMFSQDFDTTYYEAGYGNQFESIGVDYKISLIYTDDTVIFDTEESDSGETSLMLSVSKTFGLFEK